jgi:hypothetical protein
MTSIRATSHAVSSRQSHAVSAPALRRAPSSQVLTAAANDLLQRSQGNDVSFATFKTDPAKLAAFSKNAAAFKEFLFKTGMNISSHKPSDSGVHSVKKFSGSHFSKAIFDFAQVPQSVPPTADSRANEAAALKDAKALAEALHKTGGDVYTINWNNQDDTDVNILAAVNKKAGEMTFVKLFPAI